MIRFIPDINKPNAAFCCQLLQIRSSVGGEEKRYFVKCNSLAAVVAELRDISFAESRRLQLAVETSKVTGFLHRQGSRIENTLACVSRWKIRPLASQTGELPGVGFPSLEVELVKIRNGRPGIWLFEWKNGAFKVLPDQDKIAVKPQIPQKQRHYA